MKKFRFYAAKNNTLPKTMLMIEDKHGFKASYVISDSFFDLKYRLILMLIQTKEVERQTQRMGLRKARGCAGDEGRCCQSGETSERGQGYSVYSQRNCDAKGADRKFHAKEGCEGDCA